MFALDTNSVIYFFKGMGRVADRLLEVPPSQVAIPAIVLYELEVGIAKSTSSARRRSQLENLVSVVNVLPFGIEEAKASAQIRAGLERLGTPIGPLDTLIAGTALSRRATLVTRNTDEFGRIKKLKVENWF
jgi:tRNA(fMet)-specific endonuclease VapC